MYHHHPPYEYASYAPYDNPALRSLRSTSSQQSHYPPQSQQPYQSAYPPPAYAIGQPPPPQWGGGETWTSYGQPFPPPAPIQDVSFNSGPGRPDAVLQAQPPVDQRPYPPQTHPPPETRRVPERPLNAAGAVSPAQAKVRREKEVPASANAPGTPPGLDFGKLLDSYRLILDSSEAITNDSSVAAPGRPSPYETLERMIQSASYGAQMLESASLQYAASSDTRPSDPDAPPENEGIDGASSTPRRQSQKSDDAPAPEGQTCLGCNATSTPEWRRGPMGPRTLCNACGLVYAKLIKKRVRDGGRPFRKSNGKVAGGTHGHAGDESGVASSGEGGSEDGDSYGSQDRNSDHGEGGD